MSAFFKTAWALSVIFWCALGLYVTMHYCRVDLEGFFGPGGCMTAVGAVLLLFTWILTTTWRKHEENQHKSRRSNNRCDFDD